MYIFLGKFNLERKAYEEQSKKLLTENKNLQQKVEG